TAWKGERADTGGLGSLEHLDVRCRARWWRVRGPFFQIAGGRPVWANEQVDAHRVLVRRGAIGDGLAQAFVTSLLIGRRHVAVFAGKRTVNLAIDDEQHTPI